MTYYSAFYILLHTLYTLVEVILEAVTALANFCHEVWSQQQEEEHLKKELQKSTKSLKHLTVLLGREEPSFDDLANIVNWCLIHEIVYLSIYDETGKLKKNHDMLEKALARKVHPEDHVIWYSNLTYKNGFIGRKIHLKLFSREDGKNQIVQLTKNLSKRPLNQKISINSIDEKLQKSYEFPDPDVALCCGKFLSFDGYPPWQIRVTEFLSIKSHFRIKYRTFLNKLFVYGKCKQRLGK